MESGADRCYRRTMAHEGTLIFTDRDDQEHRVDVSGDLRLYEEDDGGTVIRGVVHVPEDRIDALRDAMERQAEGEGGEPGALYTGNVVDAQGNATRPVTDVPMIVRDVYDTGNARLESTAP